MSDLSRSIEEKAFDDIAAAMRDSRRKVVAREPKYQVLHDYMLDRIERNLWRPGDRLPTESVLAQILPVSLGTIQKALSMLVKNGAVERRRGYGTVVSGALTDSGKIRNFRILGDKPGSIVPLYSKVLSVQRSNSEGPWSSHFPEESSFVHIRRLMNVNMEFSTFGEAYLPESRFSRFLTLPLKSLDGMALTSMLADEFHARAVKVVNRFACGELPSGICQLINVPDGTVGLEWELFGWSFRDVPIFYQRFYLPPNSRKLEINPVRL